MAVHSFEGGTVIDTPQDIRLYRLLVLKHAMALEMKGVRIPRVSAYAVVKREFHLHGNRQRVYTQFCQLHHLEA